MPWAGAGSYQLAPFSPPLLSLEWLASRRHGQLAPSAYCRQRVIFRLLEPLPYL
jgi:hypothetical protein